MSFMLASSMQQEECGERSLRRKRGQSYLNPNETSDTFDLIQYRNFIPETEGTDLYDSEGHAAQFALPSKGVGKEHSLNEKPVWSSRVFNIDSQEPRSMIETSHDDIITEIQSSQRVWQTFLWPALAIFVPIVVISAAFLYIFLTYRIKHVENIFGPSTGLSEGGVILLDFSATKIVFLASFLSTLTPILASCMMNLMAVLAFGGLERYSDVGDYPKLPTPYQLSLLIGILAASYVQLFSSFSYLSSRQRRAKASPILLHAIGILLLTLLLGIGVTITDAYLHVATETINIALYSEHLEPDLSLGKGLDSYCLNIDRLKDNYGFPCSWPSTTALAAAPEVKDAQAEMQRIAHDVSPKSTVQLFSTEDPELEHIAYLTPASQMLPEGMNYMATTIGVSSRCSLMPPNTCNLTRWGDEGVYTSFNCSSQFWGTLGRPPSENALKQGRPVSPYLSFLAINRDSNLIYNYFADKRLEIVYNTIDLASNGTWTESSQPWPDADLKNPIYLGYAWRLPTSSFAGGRNHGMIASGSTKSYENASYVDYFLNCEVSSHDVTYTYVNGTAQLVETKKHTNGSVLNMLTDSTTYQPSAGASDSNLQDYNLQSAIAGNTTESYEARYGELISRDVLSTIGAYTSGRSVLKQQAQTTELVAKVPKPALGALLAFSLLYPVLGLVLLIKARSAAGHTGSLTPFFSYWGLVSAAFVNQRTWDLDDSDVSGIHKQDDGKEALRLFVRRDTEKRPQVGLHDISRAGQVADVIRPSTGVV